MSMIEPFEFWWVFPILMFLFCLLMCFSRRSRGMAGGCMGWRRFRDTSGDPRTDGWDDGRRSTDTSRPAEEKAETEGLKSTFDRLERRLRNLEEAVTSKEFDWNRRLNQS